MFQRAAGFSPPNDDAKLSERLAMHVDQLAGQIGPRHVAAPGALELAAEYIEEQLAALGHAVERQSFPAGSCQVANLVVEQCGRGRGDEIVILGAHYDTVPDTPGADDNASAVAMLIEVARLLRETTFQRTVRFVAFPCEEPPHFYTGTMGSQVYARQCRVRRERIVGMACLEMVGFYSTRANSQQLPPGIPRFLHWIFPRRGDFIASVGNLRSWRLVWAFRRGFRRAVRFPLFSIVLPEAIPEIRLSDNSSFWDQGYSAMMITDTSFLRNPYYHTGMDTPDTLDYRRMAQATIGVAGGIARIAGAWR